MPVGAWHVFHAHVAKMLPGSVIKQPEDERSLGAEDGGSASGKLLYCVGREAGVHQAAMCADARCS